MALFAVLWLPATASAHATLVSSDPADGTILAKMPAAAVLTFDEAVTPVRGEIQVLSPSGRVVSGAVTPAGSDVRITLNASSERGTYTLSWRVISADSHPVGGAVSFSIGAPSKPAATPTHDPSRPVTILFGAARFAAYAGFALLTGTLAFCCYGYAFAVRLRPIRRLTVGAWAVAVAGTVGSVVLQGPDAEGAGLGDVTRSALLSQTLRTTYGTAMAARLILLGLAPSLLAIGLARLERANARQRRYALAGVCVFALAIAATWSVSGHAATSGETSLTIPADLVHLLAMALWAGGLTAVLTVVRIQPRDDAMLGAVRRFSSVALGCVAALAVTGVFQGFVRVREWDALAGTDYGRLLISKVAVVAGVVSVALFSRRAVRRRLTGLAQIPKLVGIEAAGALAVLGITAVLVQAQPAAQAEAAKPVTRTVSYSTAAQDGQVQVELPDRSRGLTEATLTISDRAGRAHDVPEVDVQWSLPSRGIGPINARVTPSGSGRYLATSSPLTIAGKWRLQITVRTSDIDETTVSIEVQIR
jgi:copper transport protein